MSVTVQIDGVDEVVNRQVKGGRITGLGAWNGRLVKILVIEDQPSKDMPASEKKNDYKLRKG